MALPACYRSLPTRMRVASVTMGVLVAVGATMWLDVTRGSISACFTVAMLIVAAFGLCAAILVLGLDECIRHFRIAVSQPTVKPLLPDKSQPLVWPKASADEWANMMALYMRPVSFTLIFFGLVLAIQMQDPLQAFTLWWHFLCVIWLSALSALFMPGNFGFASVVAGAFVAAVSSLFYRSWKQSRTIGSGIKNLAKCTVMTAVLMPPDDALFGRHQLTKPDPEIQRADVWEMLPAATVGLLSATVPIALIAHHVTNHTYLVQYFLLIASLSFCSVLGCNLIQRSLLTHKAETEGSQN